MRIALPACLVRWSFERDDRRITCEVDASPDAGGYDVVTVPHWDLGATVLERFARSTLALQRHAVIVAQLREAGWNLASYTSQVVAPAV